MTNPVNPFGDFEDDFKKAAKAENTTPGRVPEATYKFVLVAQEVPPESGNLADYEVIVGKNTGTKGFKLFCEILEPEQVENPKTKEPHITKGAILDHVFWVSQKNLPYIKRDVATILGREVEALSELTSIAWAGRTFEGVVKDETYQGRVSSKIGFFNPWAPKDVKGDDKHGVAKSSEDLKKKADAEKADAKKPDPKPDPKKTQSAAKGSARENRQRRALGLGWAGKGLEERRGQNVGQGPGADRSGAVHQRAVGYLPSRLARRVQPAPVQADAGEAGRPADAGALLHGQAGP